MGLAKRVIPCLDVTAGRVVKGVNFVSLRDAGDPVEIAARYDAEGADELCFLDITASSDERDILLHVIEAVASQVFIPLTVGGGVRKVDDVRRLLNAGADKVSINTAAVQDPALVEAASGKVGNQCIVVAIDAKRVDPKSDAGKRVASGWEVYTHGGRKPTGLDAVDWARRMTAAGAGEILLTSMDRDGTRDGFDLALTRAVADAVSVPVIASGGVGTLQHLAEGVLEGGADAVLAASVFHFGDFTVRTAKEYMRARGIEALIYTDIGRDGMMTGVNVEATLKLAQAIKIPLIASGGLNSIEDVEAVCKTLVPEGVIGAITGRALYEGKIDFKKAQAAADKAVGK